MGPPVQESVSVKTVTVDHAVTFLVQARLEVAVAVGSEVVVVVIEAVAVGIEEASAEVVAVDSVEEEVGDLDLHLAL